MTEFLVLAAWLSIPILMGVWAMAVEGPQEPQNAPSERFPALD